MFFTFQRSPRTWAEEDIMAVRNHLAEAYPRMAPLLRNAIVVLAMEEIKPVQGRAALSLLSIRYARSCPQTIGLEAALTS